MFAVMTYYTRAQARRPYIADEGEQTDATYIPFNFVRPNEEAAGKPESVSAEPAGHGVLDN